MRKRAEIPVTLPRRNPTESYWQIHPIQLAGDTDTTDLPDGRVDVVIVGSGITGASIVWHLLHPAPPDSNAEEAQEAPFGTLKPLKVVMLEARNACSGATGRNGGHTKAASYRSFLSNQSTLGTEEAVKIARLELDNINAMHAWAKTGPKAAEWDVESRPCQTLDAIYDEARWTQAHEAVEAMRAVLGPDHPAARYAFHDADEVREKWHVGGDEPRPVGGVSYAAGSISSYQFTMRMLSVLQELGLELHTNTPVTRIARSARDDEWEVRTPRGVIRAAKVILATNGYTAHLWAPFQGAVVPLRGHVTAHVPGKSMPKYLPGSYSFVYEHGYEYMIQRQARRADCEEKEARQRALLPEDPHDGDIIIGGGLTKAPHDGLLEYGTTDDTTLDESIRKYLFSTTAEYFGANCGEDRNQAEGRVKKAWTGIMGYSPDGFPFVGLVPGQAELWTSCAFQGHGMALAWMCAKALVQMMRSKTGDHGLGQSMEHALERDLGEWFPASFEITEERMGRRFPDVSSLRNGSR